MSDQPIAKASNYITQTQKTNIHALSRIRFREPSNQVAADTRLRQQSHWDRPI